MGVNINVNFNLLSNRCHQTFFVVLQLLVITH